MELTCESRTESPEMVPFGSIAAVVSDLYDRYRTEVLRLCITYMRNRPDAEDATQETFLKVWRKLDCFESRNQCTVRSWIMRIACNTCKDMLRKGWRKHEDRTITPEDLPSHGCASWEDIELFMDVKNLPEKYRNVLLLVYWQGMTVRETAETICIRESTVCNRLKKARSLIEGELR